MADRMIFPKTIQEFIKEYSFKDKKEYYTNGSMLIPVFRMEQAHVYYGKEIRNRVIEEFVNKAQEMLGAEDEDIYAKECIYEIANQMKAEGSM